MVNILPVSFTTQLSPPAGPSQSSSNSGIRLYFDTPRTLGASSATELSDEQMEIDDNLPLSSTPSSSSSIRREEYFMMETDTDEFDEAVPASDEIYHAVVRLVDANEAVNGHFIQVDAPSIIDVDDDEDEEMMIGDVLLSSSDSDTDSTASWKSVRSENSEDNENRSHGLSTPTHSTAPTFSPWESPGPNPSLASTTTSTPRRNLTRHLLPPAGLFSSTPNSTASNSPRNRSSGMTGTIFDSFSRRNLSNTSLRTFASENVSPSSSTNIPRSQKRVSSQKAAARCESSSNPSQHPYYIIDSGDLRPHKFDTLLSNPPLDQETLEKHSWNPEDRSLNIFVKDDDKLTFHRHPVAQSTDCIRGKMGYSTGFHVWKFTWPQRMRGTHAVIGLATKAAPLHQVGYVSLIGQNPESYGWDIIRNKCYHDGKVSNGWNYPSSSAIGDSSFTVPDSFYCILDMDDGYMAFASETKFFGIAFCDLKGKKLYPIVSAVWGHCEVTMRYIGGLDPEPRQLMEICRRSIQMQIGKSIKSSTIQQLPIPPILQNYIMYK